MSDQTPGTPQNPPVEPPAQPPVEPQAQPAAPPPVPQQPAPVAAQPTPPPTPPPAQPAAPPAAPPAYAPAPAAPGGPVPPGYAPAPQPPGGGGYFKSGKNKTIALIVGGVIAVGAIGGVAALLAGGGDSDKEVATSAAAPEGSGVLEPAPVGSTDPAEPTPTDTPSDTPSSEAPTDEPTTEAPSPEPEPPSGDSVTIGGNVVVPVPSGWQVLGNGDVDVAMSDGGPNYVYAVTGTVKPSADAGQVLMNSLESILPPDQYPDLATSDVVPQTPGGSIVSLALIEYEGTWTDGQGTTPVHGAIFSAVRQDGTALILLGEHTPPEEFADIYSSQLQPVLDGILLPFAGLG